MESHFVNEIYEQIWNDRYRKNNESYQDNLKRVAEFISGAEKEEKEHWREAFFGVMNNGLFFPAGRTMSNCGIGDKLGLNNCHTAPQVPNDIPSIFGTVRLGAITHKAGGKISAS